MPTTAAPPPAVAAASDMTPAFAGTITSVYPDGRVARLWLRADGGYRARGRRGDATSGHWRLTGARLCMKQARPWPIPFSYCTPLVSGGIGAHWSARAPTGEAIAVTLAPGRAGEPSD